MGAASSADAAAADLALGRNSISGPDSDAEYYDAHSSADEIMVPTPPQRAAAQRTAAGEDAILATTRTILTA